MDALLHSPRNSEWQFGGESISELTASRKSARQFMLWSVRNNRGQFPYHPDSGVIRLC